MDDNTKFCPSCGAQVENTQQQQQQAPKQQEAPRQFGYQGSVDESQNAHYQKTAFKGKQFSTGTSGSIGFGSGNRKKRGFFGRLIKIGIIAIAAIVVFTLFFGDNGPVYDIATSASIDPATYYPIDATSTFPSSTPEIYVTYSSQDLEIGSRIYAYWYYMDTDEGTLEATQYMDTTYEEQVGYFYLQAPSGWDVGEYEIRFEVDGEIVAIETFTVE